MTTQKNTFFSAVQVRRLISLQNVLVPRAKAFTESEQARSLSLIESLLAARPKSLKRQFFFFLFLIDVLAFFTGLKSFARLSSEKKLSLMRALFDSPIPLIRKGFWGLNTLLKLGVYGQEGLHAEIGYHLREVPRG